MVDIENDSRERERLEKDEKELREPDLLVPVEPFLAVLICRRRLWLARALSTCAEVRSVTFSLIEVHLKQTQAVLSVNCKFGKIVG